MRRLARAIWLASGLALVALGVIGIFLPVLPTTPFLILAAACFARSSPRLEAWLLDHPRFGPMLRDWRERGAIPRRGKIWACLGSSLGFALFLTGGPHGPWLTGAVALFCVSGAAYVLTRPTA